MLNALCILALSAASEGPTQPTQPPQSDAAKLSIARTKVQLAIRGGVLVDALGGSCGEALHDVDVLDVDGVRRILWRVEAPGESSAITVLTDGKGPFFVDESHEASRGPQRHRRTFLEGGRVLHVDVDDAGALTWEDGAPAIALDGGAAAQAAAAAVSAARSRTVACGPSPAALVARPPEIARAIDAVSAAVGVATGAWQSAAPDEVTLEVTPCGVGTRVGSILSVEESETHAHVLFLDGALADVSTDDGAHVYFAHGKMVGLTRGSVSRGPDATRERRWLATAARCLPPLPANRPP